MKAWFAAGVLGAVSLACAGTEQLTTAATITVSLQRGPTPVNPPPETSSDGNLRFDGYWRISLDAAGRVTNLDGADNKLIDDVRLPLEKAIRTWQFVPGTIQGKPAPTETTLALDFTLVPSGTDKYAVRIDDARTGGHIGQKGMHAFPTYPGDAIRHHKDGMVVLKIDYDANGHVTAANPRAGAPDIDIVFVRSAQHAVKRWTFSPETVAGHGLAGSVIVPICFLNYVEHAPTANYGCRWVAPEGHGGIGEGGVVALEPAAKLQTAVIGHTH